MNWYIKIAILSVAVGILRSAFGFEMTALAILMIILLDGGKWGEK